VQYIGLCFASANPLAQVVVLFSHSNSTLFLK
jgi:hypothetical protein